MLEFLYAGEDIRNRTPQKESNLSARGHEFDDSFRSYSELMFLYTGEDIRDKQVAAGQPKVVPRGYEFEDVFDPFELAEANGLSFLHTGEDIRNFNPEVASGRGHEFDEQFGAYYEELGSYYDDEDNTIFNEFARYMRNLYRKERQREKENDREYTF